MASTHLERIQRWMQAVIMHPSGVVPGIHSQATRGAISVTPATVERVYSEVFDGTGVEGQTLLGAGEMAAISPDDWVDARLVPVCCLRLIPLRFPAHEYLAALKLKQQPSSPQPVETYLAMTRR